MKALRAFASALRALLSGAAPALVAMALYFVWVQTVNATPETDDRLREIIAELSANNDAIVAEAQGIRFQLAQAEKAKAELQAEITAEAGRANALIAARDAAVAKLRESLQGAVAAQEKAEADESWWRWRCLGLAALVLGWVGLKVVPYVLRFLPAISL